MKKTTFRILGLCTLVSVFFFTSCGRKSTDSNVIKIGAMFPLSGDAAVYGKSARNGIILAQTHFNGQAKYQVQVVFEDTQANPLQAVSAFRLLSDVEKVSACLGPMTSGEVLSVAPFANQRNIVIFSPTASAPKITDAGEYVFRNLTSDAYDGVVMARFAAETLGVRKAGVVYINNEFGYGLKQSFTDEAKAQKIDLPVVDGFSEGATDFRTIVMKIKEYPLDAVFLVGGKEMATMIKQLREAGLRTRVLSVGIFEDSDILKRLGTELNGSVYTYRSFDLNSTNTIVTDFVRDYRELFGCDPDLYSAQSYDAALILFRCCIASLESKIEMKEALYNVQEFIGVTGSTSFDRNGDVFKPIKIKTVRDGRFVWFKE